MNDELTRMAAHIANELEKLEFERLRIGRQGLGTLKRLDPETAKMVTDLWDDPGHAADWFTIEVQSLGWKTPGDASQKAGARTYRISSTGSHTASLCSALTMRRECRRSMTLQRRITQAPLLGRY